MRVTIHQPEHLPWLGLFHKIDLADMFVVLDNVQFRRRYFQNRNKIRTHSGWDWVTVPIENGDRDSLLIQNVRIFKANLSWKSRNLRAIQQYYSTADFFNSYWEEFIAIYNSDFDLLRDLNVSLIKFFLSKLGIKKNIKLSSELGCSGKKGDLIFDICKTVGADTYVSGVSGKNYLDLYRFKQEKISVEFQEFFHPIYRQKYAPFIPCMSVIDLLFGFGSQSLDIIKGRGVLVMDTVFL